MRPTIDEQLRQTCRILEDVIAPALSADHASEVLRSLIANLRMLESCWHGILPFLRWENDTVEALLRETGGLTAMNDEPDAAQPDPFDVKAMSAYNDRLLALLEQRIIGSTAADPALDAIRVYLMERASRYPMRSVLPTPQTRAIS